MLDTPGPRLTAFRGGKSRVPRTESLRQTNSEAMGTRPVGTLSYGALRRHSHCGRRRHEVPQHDILSGS